nr:hypothetical protein [Tanacetum cinerariifolium]
MLLSFNSQEILQLLLHLLVGVSKTTEKPKEPKNRTGTIPEPNHILEPWFLVLKIPNFWFSGRFGTELAHFGSFPKRTDEGKSLKPSKSTLPSSSSVVSKKVDDLVNEDNDSEVDEVYDETATYMASTSFNVNKASKSGSGGGNKSVYEKWKESHGEDPNDDDDFDDPGLTNAQMKFVNAFDINLRGQLR